MTSNKNQTDIKRKLENCLRIVRMYDWLLDSYVLVRNAAVLFRNLIQLRKQIIRWIFPFCFQDFFVDNHWSKLPESWIHTFENLPPEHLADLLIPNKFGNSGIVWPLSLLSLRVLAQQISIDRKQVKCTSNPTQVNINKSKYTFKIIL